MLASIKNFFKDRELVHCNNYYKSWDVNITLRNGDILKILLTIV